MDREKDIAVKEAFFTPGKDPTQANHTDQSIQEERPVPVLDEVTPASESDLHQYRRALREYFVSGEKTSESLGSAVAPVLLAPYIRGQSPDMEYPLFCEDGNAHATPVRQLLEDTFESLFKENEANALREQLHYAERILREALHGKQQAEFQPLAREAMRAIRELETPALEWQTHHEHCEKFEAALLKKQGILTGFSGLAPFRILNRQLEIGRQESSTFLADIRKCIAGLNELLQLHRQKSGPSQLQEHFRFADEMIAFDKVEGLMPGKPGSGLPETTLNRVRGCLETLEKGQAWLEENNNRVYVAKALEKEFSLKKILSAATLRVVSGNPCSEIASYFRNAIQRFVGIIAALRMGRLEIDQKYDENLHTPYFNGFGLLHLSTGELSRFPAPVVIDESHQLMHQLEEFLTLITSNVPVRVLAVTRLNELDIPQNNAEQADLSYELATLAISHRKAYVFQGAADLPSMLEKAINEGLGCPAPAFWNILVTDPKTDEEQTDFLAANVALESRCFPRIVYNVDIGDRFGSHFDISGNTQPGQSFPSWPLDIETTTGKQQEEYSLTVADYFALDKHKRAALELVPAQYRNSDLLPLDTYLSAPHDTLIGKIPFIWMLDEKNTLQLAALPLSWLRRCKERLDYWQFIQELGGVNSYHVQRAVEQSRSDWETEKEAAMEELRAQMEEAMERMRNDEVGHAMQRVIQALLDPDQVAASPQSASAQARPVVKPETNVPQEAEQADQPVEKEPETAPVRSDVWVETFRCTSCSDCIDALPAVFRYNDDKQAVVHNPKGGTYAKIVGIAEKCPARCIHPGLPQNPNEPGLDKLIKRAEKFN